MPRSVNIFPLLVNVGLFSNSTLLLHFIAATFAGEDGDDDDDGDDGDIGDG
jgi:hypothetical protein